MNDLSNILKDRHNKFYILTSLMKIEIDELILLIKVPENLEREIEEIKKAYICGKTSHMANEGWTYIYTAYIIGDYETVKDELKNGTDPETENNDGWTLLSHACYFGKKEFTQLFLYYGVDMTKINLFDYKQQLNLPDEFTCTSTNEDIRAYLIKDINYHR